MDQETLTNHISHLGKHDFEIACKIVLRNVFCLNAINVDGVGDGGTDFISIKSDGTRSNVAYQITTQKKDIVSKAYKDAKKVIEKLGADRFYFLTTLNLSETEARKIESEISNKLDIQAICFGARHIAGFLIEEYLLNQFLDESSYPLPRNFAQSPDYREMALHAYTLMSKDTSNMKEGIYEDTILFILSDKVNAFEDDLIKDVLNYLRLSDEKEDYIKFRIGSLFSQKKLIKLQDGSIALNEKSKEDLDFRKRIYERELSDLSSAQIDLMHNDFDSDWTIEDSKIVSVFIADIYIASQIETLKDIKASIVINPIFHVEDNGIDSLKRYLIQNRKVSLEHLEPAVDKLIKTASAHPLINKLARASVYVALEGSNPTSSAKALGAARWSDYSLLVDSSVAIPWICAQLYIGNKNRFFKSSVKAIERAKELDASLHITYFYINECAGHLIGARKYAGLKLDPRELQFSTNAYISNYYSLLEEGIRVPENLLDYLRTFSPAVLISRTDNREWVRAVMTDLQTILTRSDIEFLESPKYDHSQCSTFEKEYLYYLNQYKMDKPKKLIDHDVWALQLTNNLITCDREHWLILTYDKALINVGKTDVFSGWVATPDRFLSFTENFRPLAEAQYISILHSFASYSEKTLSAGARIIDKIVQYASSEMQNWEFQKDFNEFKKGVIDNTDLNLPNAIEQLDVKTEEFLKKHGIDPKSVKTEDIID